MKPRKIAALVGAGAVVLGVGAWGIWAGGLLGPGEHLPSSVTLFRGQTYAAPPEPQSGLDLAALPVRTPDPARALTPTQVQTLWQPLAELAQQSGWTAWAYIKDADTGEVLLDQSGRDGHTPASILKVLTTLVALEDLDATAPLQTGVSRVGSTLYLWGQGDLLLTAGTSTGTVNGQAGLADLAQQTASALTSQGIKQVKLAYQDRLFEGDSRLPAWTAQEVTDFAGDVGPYAIDTGRTSPGAWEFVDNSAAEVANTFAEALRGQGIAVDSVAVGTAPAEAEPVAHVDSAPQYEQIAYLLRTSDNTMAEQYCHLSALKQGAPTTFAGATAHLIYQLQQLGVDTTGLTLEDCSGLSSNSKVPPHVLVDALEASLRPGSSSAELLRLLPRGGTVGTLDERFGSPSTAGNLQAKTGSLGSVSSLTGVVTTAGGQQLLFAVGVDNAPGWTGYLARDPIDDFVTSLVEAN